MSLRLAALAVSMAIEVGAETAASTPMPAVAAFATIS